MLYDHVLSRGWATWRTDARDSFIANTQHTLLEHAHLMPPPMRLIVQRMADEYWLSSYLSAPGLRDRLVQMSDRLSQRVGRAMDLTLSVSQIERAHDAIAPDFARLWPDLLQHVAEHRRRAESARLAC